jgi:nicotinic acid phosphoribosyltransferase
MTDAYKFSMAQAGFPLRQETFHLTLRRGGPFYIPFDFAQVVKALCPSPPKVSEESFLYEGGYTLTPAMREALTREITVHAAPKGSWVLAGEPIFTVTGPSFLVSWLEPLCIMLHYPIQIGTVLASKRELRTSTTCMSEREILRLVLQQFNKNLSDASINCDDSLYADNARYAAARVLGALRNDRGVFEVGLRAATCMEQHEIALRICHAAGFQKTSNVWLARKLMMDAVGTTGHEHQQRWGSDRQAFRAVRDMRPGDASYLFDTYDPMNVGIPEVFSVAREQPSAPFTVRFDSGNQEAQLRALVAIEAEGILPRYIFEDGYTATRMQENERLCDLLGIDTDRRAYGFGGYLVSQPSISDYNRDAVSAAYKLSNTGGHPTMKFSGTPGKISVPGKPVILRRVDSAAGPVSMVAQDGETVPGFAPLDPTDPRQAAVPAGTVTAYSPLTVTLVQGLTLAKSNMEERLP